MRQGRRTIYIFCSLNLFVIYHFLLRMIYLFNIFWWLGVFSIRYGPRKFQSHHTWFSLFDFKHIILQNLTSNRRLTFFYFCFNCRSNRWDNGFIIQAGLVVFSVSFIDRRLRIIILLLRSLLICRVYSRAFVFNIIVIISIVCNNV